MVARKNIGKNGQAAIEMALSLPFLIWLIYYTINAFYSIHTAHVGQKYAAMGVYTRMDNRAKFIVDDVANEAVGVGYMAVQFMDENGNPPQRKILKGPTQINTTIGICREPDCN